MSTKQEQLDALHDIRNMMERSSRFLSLSGLAGVVVGVLAILTTWAAYGYMGFIDIDYQRFITESGSEKSADVLHFLIRLYLLVLVISLLAGSLMAIRKARKLKLPVWDATAKRLAINMFIPLAAGGIFCLIMIEQGNYGLIPPVTLLFYGLALLNATKFTIDDIRTLGLLEMVIGLFAAYRPELGLILWAIGFGVLHIIYGIWIHFKYER